MSGRTSRPGHLPGVALQKPSSRTKQPCSASPTRPPPALPPLCRRDAQYRTYLHELQAKAKKHERSIAAQAERMQRRRQLLAARILSLHRSTSLQRSGGVQCCTQQSGTVTEAAAAGPSIGDRASRTAERGVSEQPLPRARSLPARPGAGGLLRASSRLDRWAEEFSRWKLRRKLDAETKVFVFGGTGNHSGMGCAVAGRVHARLAQSSQVTASVQRMPCMAVFQATR